MTDLFLLAVKSRGEPSFEIGEKLRCPECAALHEKADPDMEVYCPECDSLGFWWITNAGYRAHPYEYHRLDSIQFYGNSSMQRIINDCPAEWPDLFPAKQSKSILSSGKSLLATLGLLPKVVRRL